MDRLVGLAAAAASAVRSARTLISAASLGLAISMSVTILCLAAGVANTAQRSARGKRSKYAKRGVRDNHSNATTMSIWSVSIAPMDRTTFGLSRAVTRVTG